MIKPISGLTINSKKPGPTITIMAGVHGNEICGIKAFKTVIPNLKLKKGKVYFILANLKAIKLGKRQYQVNLNRLFQEDKFINNKIKKTYEYQRSREILPYLNDSMALLDIHSSANKDSIPFTICEKPFFDIAKKMPTKIISSGFVKMEPGGTDYYMYNNKKISICIECGSHISDLSNQNAIDAIYTFLSCFNMIQKPSQKIAKVNFIYKTKTNFKLIKYFKDFEPIKKGSTIGYDGNQKVISQQNGFILFAVSRKSPDKEAFLLGKYI